jgi:4-aminobutyrate aminotransferase/(S)-3-amino-2-methylpropionate transaminase
MLAVEVNDIATHAPRADIVSAVAAEAAQHGLLVLTAGTYGNVLRFLPSLAITDAQLADAVSVLDACFAAATA